MYDLNEMTREQLRELIGKAQARIAELEPPRKTWAILLFREKTILEHIGTAIEAADADAALAAAVDREGCLQDSGGWECDDEKVVSCYESGEPEESDYDPEYRVNAEGKLEDVE